MTGLLRGAFTSLDGSAGEGGRSFLGLSRLLCLEPIKSRIVGTRSLLTKPREFMNMHFSCSLLSSSSSSQALGTSRLPLAAVEPIWGTGSGHFTFAIASSIRVQRISVGGHMHGRRTTSIASDRFFRCSDKSQDFPSPNLKCKSRKYFNQIFRTIRNQKTRTVIKKTILQFVKWQHSDGFSHLTFDSNLLRQCQASKKGLQEKGQSWFLQDASPQTRRGFSRSFLRRLLKSVWDVPGIYHGLEVDPRVAQPYRQFELFLCGVDVAILG